MEQLNQLYEENVIEPFWGLEQSRNGTDQFALNQFIQKLLTTIDLDTLIEMYYQQLKASLQLCALKIQFQDSQLYLGKDIKNSHTKTLNCMNMNSAVAVISYMFRDPMSIRDWQMLQSMHINFCYPLKNALEHHKVKQFAMKDALTSLGNRASYDDSILRLMCQSERQCPPFGLLVLDMDNFKQVNDNYGHQEGDNVLVAAAQTILSSLRESDFAFRFGGDEFCCLLPDSDTSTNRLIAERILSAIASQPLLNKHRVTCSVGASTYQRVDSQLGIFSRADEALYRAKQSGKNQVCVS